MRTIKLTLTFLLFTLLILPINQCKKETIKETLSFGIKQTDFKVDSIYKASSDGFLLVQYSSPIEGGVMINVYSDKSSNPTTIIAKIYFPNLTNIPIQQNNYWKVEPIQNNLQVNISWTPIQ